MTVHRVHLTVESVEGYFDSVLADGFRWERDQGAVTEEDPLRRPWCGRPSFSS